MGILNGEVLIMTITLPPDIEGPLAQAAREQGTTPERLAVDSLRQMFTSGPETAVPAEGETLYDFLSGYVGTISGTTEALSENCGDRFTDGLVAKQRQGHL